MTNFRPFHSGDSSAVRNRRWRLRRIYGIEEHQYEEMMQQQSGKCAIPSCENRAEHIDHDHETGGVRGLLCLRCNLILGMAKESQELLCGIAEYLRESSRRELIGGKRLPSAPAKKASPEEREWRRQLMLGNKHSAGKPSWNKGKKCPPETVAKLREARKKWWDSLTEEERQKQRNFGRRGAAARWEGKK